MVRVLAWLCGSGFWVTALAMLSAGLWLPGDYRRVQPLVPVFLGGILFFTALKVDVREVWRTLHSAQQRRWLLATGAIKLLALPLLAWAMASVVAPKWALGVLVVMAMPAGLTAAAMADLYRASVPFALLLTLLTSVLCPLSVPLLTRALDPQTTVIDGAALAGRALYIVTLLVVPFALAQGVRHWLPRLVARHQTRWGMGAVLSSCLLIFASVSANRHAWAHLPQVHLLLPLALVCVALALTTLLVLGAHRVLPSAEAGAFGFCCLWMNNGLAVAFCTRFYHDRPEVLLPCVLMQVPIIASVAFLGWWRNRQTAVHATPAD